MKGFLYHITLKSKYSGCFLEALSFFDKAVSIPEIHKNIYVNIQNVNHKFYCCMIFFSLFQSFTFIFLYTTAINIFKLYTC